MISDQENQAGGVLGAGRFFSTIFVGPIVFLEATRCREARCRRPPEIAFVLARPRCRRCKELLLAPPRNRFTICHVIFVTCSPMPRKHSDRISTHRSTNDKSITLAIPHALWCQNKSSDRGVPRKWRRAHAAAGVVQHGGERGG